MAENLRGTESESINLEIEKPERTKQINLWLKKIETREKWKVHGFVYDYETGEPITYATVVLDSEGTGTNTRGYFQFKDVESGTHVLEVRKSGYEDSGDQNKPSRVEFTLD